MSIYFNEFDKGAAAWLRNLYPTATVDERDIRDVQPRDVAGFRRCHFFGGIGGWQYALDLAGWGDAQVWSGSCPCQPYSAAGKQLGNADERNLWPAFYRLIRECRPECIFGEQVEGAIGHRWLDGVSADLEGEGYAVGAIVLGAHSVGAPHIRQRLYWVADSSGTRLEGRSLESARHECEAAERSGGNGGMADANVAELRGLASTGQQSEHECNDGASGMGDAESSRYSRREHRSALGEEEAAGSRQLGVSGSGEVLLCRDGRRRRVPIESSLYPLAHGIPRDVGRRFPELRSVAASARSNRVTRLKGYGNAIVPQVAALFIESFVAARHLDTKGSG